MLSRPGCIPKKNPFVKKITLQSGGNPPTVTGRPGGCRGAIGGRARGGRRPIASMCEHVHSRAQTRGPVQKCFNDVLKWQRSLHGVTVAAMTCTTPRNDQLQLGCNSLQLATKLQRVCCNLVAACKELSCRVQHSCNIHLATLWQVATCLMQL